MNFAVILNMLKAETIQYFLVKQRDPTFNIFVTIQFQRSAKSERVYVPAMLVLS